MMIAGCGKTAKLVNTFAPRTTYTEKDRLLYEIETLKGKVSEAGLLKWTKIGYIVLGTAFFTTVFNFHNWQYMIRPFCAIVLPERERRDVWTTAYEAGYRRGVNINHRHFNLLVDALDPQHLYHPDEYQNERAYEIYLDRLMLLN